MLEASEPLAPLVRDVPRFTGDETDLTTFPLSLAFVGQHDAGKTSLINVLTGADLPVGAGVVTEFAEEIPWEGVRLIDTPGVQTGTREEHDARSQAAYREADLIVFVITTALLDNAGMLLLQELAGTQRKASQMILVVNKTSQDTVSPKALHEAVQRAIAPHDLPIVLCDAQDHLRAATEDDEELRDELLADANVDGLSEALTQLASRSGVLGKLATPAQNGLSVCETAISLSGLAAEAAEASAADLRARAAGYESAASHLAEGGARILDQLHRKAVELADEPCGLILEGSKDDSPDGDADLGALLLGADAELERLQQQAVEELGDLVSNVQERLEADQVAVSKDGEIARLTVGASHSLDVAPLSSRKWQSWIEESSRDILQEAAREVMKRPLRLPTGSSPGEDLHRLVHQVKKAVQGSAIKPWSVVNSAKKIEGIAKIINTAEPGVRRAVGKGVDLALEEGFRRWNETKREARSSELRRSFEEAAGSVTEELRRAVDDLVGSLEKEANESHSHAEGEDRRGAGARSAQQELAELRDTFRELQSAASELRPEPK